MSARGWKIGVAIVLLSFVPSAAGATSIQPAPEAATVTFYAHWTDVLDRAPLNTLPPDPETEPDINQGFDMPTLVLRTPCPAVCDVTFQNNLLTMFTLPSETPTRDGPIDHDTRDPSYEVRLGDGPMFAVLYLSAHPVPTQNSSTDVGQPTTAGTMPLVRVDARWETGRSAGGGTVIAAGSAQDNLNMVSLPGSDPVYEIRVPLGRFVDSIPWGDSFGNPTPGTVFSVQLHQVAQSDSEVLQSSWRLRSGAEYPWRLEVPMENPLLARGLQSSVRDETMFVQWTVKAAWGAYDIDADAFRLRVTDPDGATATLAPTRLQYSPLHDAQLRSVHAFWELRREQLPGAEPWHLQATVTNQQGTFTLHETAEAVFPVYAGENSTPGFEIGVLALALLALLRRRA